ncbi:hypothetical protein Bca4012_004865 [Brassica carinata]
MNLLGARRRRFFSSVALLVDSSHRWLSSLFLGCFPRRILVIRWLSSKNDGGYGGGIKSVALSEDDNRRLLLIAIERIFVSDSEKELQRILEN